MYIVFTIHSGSVERDIDNIGYISQTIEKEKGREREERKMAFIRSLLTAANLVLALAVVTNGQKDLTTIGLGGQLSGSTLAYIVNKGDARAGGSDTVTMIYTVPQDSWVAIGFSENGQMVGSSAVIALPSSGEVKKYDMTSIIMTGVVPMPEDQQTLIEPSVVQEGGTTTLQFTKILDEANELPIVIGPNTFIAAYGFGNIFFVHQARGSFSVDLVEGVVETVETRKKALWKAHGWCAALAWGIFSPIAIGAAILRKWFPDGLWLKIHQYLNLLVLLLTIAAFALGVAAINEETPVGGNPRHFSAEPYPHRTIGLIVFVFVMIQLLGGQFRPNTPGKGEDKTRIRSSWEILHRVLGISLLAASWYQVESGLQIYQTLFVDSTTNLSSTFWGIVGAISGLIALGFVVIQIKGDKDDDSDSDSNQNDEKNSNEDSC
ncbi:MAG: hypothetical protein ACI8RD_000008 [Bacillariaceae sp.]